MTGSRTIKIQVRGISICSLSFLNNVSYKWKRLDNPELFTSTAFNVHPKVKLVLVQASVDLYIRSIC